MRGSFEVEATSELMAVVSGKRRFALQEGTADWSENANRYEVRQIARRETTAAGHLVTV